MAFSSELSAFLESLESIVKIFLSYASEDQRVAEEISLALAGEGHEVFFDRASLPAAGEYHRRIREAVDEADAIVFLISRFSVSKNSYALSELQLAKAKWKHPMDRLLPVIVSETDWTMIPEYLKAVTILRPEGNISADVAAAFTQLARKKNGKTPSWTQQIWCGRDRVYYWCCVSMVGAASNKCRGNGACRFVDDNIYYLVLCNA